MANIKSAKKRIKQTVKKTNYNNYWRKAMKKAISAFEKSNAKDKTNSLNIAKSVIDKSAKKRVISKNKASRIKSRLQKKV